MDKSKQYELLGAPPASSSQQLTAHPSIPRPVSAYLQDAAQDTRGENEGTQSLHKGNKRATHAELKRSNEGTQHALLLPSFQPLVTSLRATRLLRHDNRVGRQDHVTGPEDSNTAPNILESAGGWNSTSAQSCRSCHAVVMTTAQDPALAPVQPPTTGLSCAAWYDWPQAVPLQGLPALGQMDIASQQCTLQRRAYVQSTLESYRSLSSYLYLDTQSPLPSFFLVLRYTIQLFHCHQTTPLTAHC